LSAQNLDAGLDFEVGSRANRCEVMSPAQQAQ
jgi:hypothetical protein